MLLLLGLPAIAHDLVSPRQWTQSEIAAMKLRVTSKGEDGWLFQLFERVRVNLPLPGSAGDGTATNIASAVVNIKDHLEGTVPGSVLKELAGQLQEKTENGALILEASDDVLTFLQSNTQGYLDFVFGSSAQGINSSQDGRVKCLSTTGCGIMRSELIEFLREFAALAPQFPLISHTGLDDTERAERIINEIPPIVSYFLEDHWHRVQPVLEQLPDDLRDVHTFMDDPDLFRVNFARDAIKEAGKKTPLQRFCSDKRKKGRKNRPSLDPVRLNRILLLLSITKGAIATLGDGETSICASILGEGTCDPAKSPFTLRLKAMAFVLDSIIAAVNTRRANLALCT